MPNPIPETNAEVFRDYYPLIVWHVGRAGIENGEVEDEAMSLMARFIENGVLTDYDPDMEGAASFRTFLSGFVLSYVRHRAHRDRIRRDRSAISTDETVSFADGGEVSLLDWLGKVTEDDTSEAELRASLETITTKIPKELSLFLSIVLLQVEEHGKIDRKELAEMFGVTRETIRLWLNKIRPIFDEVLKG
jgi:RNA polymerase sigma factor (sigma-70 family)